MDGTDGTAPVARAVPSRRPWYRRIASGLAVAFASLLVTLLAIEIPAVLGYVDYRHHVGTMVPRHDAAGDRPPNRPVQIRMKGDLVPYYRIPDTPVRDNRFLTDGRGFRNPIHRSHAPVVVIGDSFVENSTIPDDEIFTTLLGRELDIEVVNLGRAGWGPNDELGALRRYAIGLRPRVAIWVFYEGNDLADILMYPGPEIRWIDRLFMTGMYARIAVLIDRIWGESSRANFTWQEDAPFGSCHVRCAAEPCPTMYFGNLVGRLTLFEEVSLGRAQRLIATAAREARQANIELVLAFAPATLRVYRNLCEFPEPNLAQTTPINDLPQRMAVFAERERIGFVDLTSALQAAAARGEHPHYPDDTHWTPAANRVVAHALAMTPAVRTALGLSPLR